MEPQDRINKIISNNQLTADQRLHIEPISTESENSPNLYVSGSPSIAQTKAKHTEYTFNVLKGEHKGLITTEAKQLSIAQEEQIGMLLLEVFHESGFITEDNTQQSGDIGVKFNQEVKLSTVISTFKHIGIIRQIAHIATGVDMDILDNVSSMDFLTFVEQLLENEPQIQETITTFFTGQGKTKS